MNINRSPSLRRRFVALIVMAVALWARPAYGHGGDDHGEAAPARTTAPSAQGAALTTHGSTDLFELLVKYPAVDAGDDTRLRLFLADFATNRPIDSARFTLAFTPAGVEVVQPPRMTAPGIYEIVARFPDDTLYNLVATVSAGAKTDFVEVRNIYAGDAATTFLADHSALATAIQPEPTGPWWLIPAVVGAMLAVIGVVVMRRRGGGTGGTTGRAGRRDRQ